MNDITVSQQIASVGENCDLDELLTVEEVAQRFKVPRTWVYAAVRGRTRRKLPHVRIGRYIRFEETAVKLFIESNKQAYPTKSTNR
jgi:excisionase family DNA binding protein